MFKVICIGDSLTTGYGISKENTWFNLLRNKFNTIDFINKGINGNLSTDMLFRFYDDVISAKPTHCLILCGTNDFFLSHSSKRVLENITLMHLDCISNNIIPIIIIPIKVHESLAIKFWDSLIDYKLVNNKIEELRILLKNYCIKSNINLIDLNISFDYNDECLYIDGVHPSVLGNQLILKNVSYNIYQLFD